MVNLKRKDWYAALGLGCTCKQEEFNSVTASDGNDSSLIIKLLKGYDAVTLPG